METRANCRPTRTSGTSTWAARRMADRRDTRISSSTSAMEKKESPALPALLEVKGVDVRFGGVTAIDDVSFRVARRAIHAIIGPNGAGKTSLLNCVSGVYRPQAGSVHLEG